MRDALGRYQRALLLGGSSDIGLAIVTRLVREHGVTEVVLAGRDPEGIGERTSELSNRCRVHVERFDATDGADAHRRWTGSLWDRYGDIDIVIVAFGLLGDQAAAEADPTRAVEIATTNYVGGVSIGLTLADRMVRQGHGAIVFLSSVAGERTRPSNFVYGSSKAGLDAFAQGLGRRFAGDGLQVMLVRPGFVRSRMTAGMDPAPFAVDPDRVARDVSGGLRRGARTVYSPPVLRGVMSALRHLPEPLFRKVADREAATPPGS